MKHDATSLIQKGPSSKAFEPGLGRQQDTQELMGGIVIRGEGDVKRNCGCEGRQFCETTAKHVLLKRIWLQGVYAFAPFPEKNVLPDP